MKTKLKIPEALVKTAEPAVELEPISTELEQASDMLLDSVLQTKDHMQTYYDTLLNAENPEITDIEVRQKLDSYKRAAGNIKKAHLVTSDITDELSARWSDLRNSQKRKLIPSAPANAVIDAQESRSNHFARGLNAYKLLLLCFIGSFLGVVVELGWCLLTRGYLESRSGLVYGPFNLLYGVGAVVLTVTLYNFRNRGKWLSFAGGTIVGSIVEYICSWAQEMAFGSRSWITAQSRLISTAVSALCTPFFGACSAYSGSRAFIRAWRNGSSKFRTAPEKSSHGYLPLSSFSTPS